MKIDEKQCNRLFERNYHAWDPNIQEQAQSNLDTLLQDLLQLKGKIGLLDDSDVRLYEGKNYTFAKELTPIFDFCKACKDHDYLPTEALQLAIDQTKKLQKNHWLWNYINAQPKEIIEFCRKWAGEESVVENDEQPSRICGFS